MKSKDSNEEKGTDHQSINPNNDSKKSYIADIDFEIQDVEGIGPTTAK